MAFFDWFRRRSVRPGPPRSPRARVEKQTDHLTHFPAGPTRRSIGIARGYRFDFLGDPRIGRLTTDDGSPERIVESSLPDLQTPDELASWIGITSAQLHWLTYQRDDTRSPHYHYFDVVKRSGGVRTLSAPRPMMAGCQRRILSDLLNRLTPHPAAHGFVAGRSIATNAAPHVGRSVVVNIDLSDFFPSITFPRVRGLFFSVGYNRLVATLLALLCTDRTRHRSLRGPTRPCWRAIGPHALPQGACTSPAISNLISRTLDRRLTGLGGSVGWTYTRYADDLTFSADVPVADDVGYLLHRVRGITADEGFRVNESKTRVQRRGSRQTVTGLVVNDRVTIDRVAMRRLRAILHDVRQVGWSAANREGHGAFENHVRGWVAYAESVDPVKGWKLRAALSKIEGWSGRTRPSQ